MQKFDVQMGLERLAEALDQWKEAKATFDGNVKIIMDRLIREAARAHMSAEDVAKHSGFTPKRVRAMMRASGLDPKKGKTLLAKQAADALNSNAIYLGIEPHEIDLMSPLAYLPMGEKMRRELEDSAVSQTTEDAHTALLEDIKRLMPSAAHEALVEGLIDAGWRK